MTPEIEKALFGRRKGGRIKVAPPEQRTADGIIFDSKHEMEVYLQFQGLVRAGTFKEMRLQVPYVVIVRDLKGQDVPVFKWLADFVVTDLSGAISVYDAKGMRTDIYKLKKKCVEAQYGIRILEV